MKIGTFPKRIHRLCPTLSQLRRWTKICTLSFLDGLICDVLKIGFERDTPAEDGLKMRGLVPGTVTAFDVSEDAAESPTAMLSAVQNGQIDVLITWEPVISSFLGAYPDLEVAPVPNSRALGPPEQYAFPMSMGVREGNHSLKERLDEAIQKHQAEITAILTESGVKLYTPGERIP